MLFPCSRFKASADLQCEAHHETQTWQAHLFFSCNANSTQTSCRP